MGFLRKNLNFFDIPKGGKFAVECVSNGIISQKCLFRHNFEVYVAKTQKKLRAWDKLENMMKKECFFSEKNVFIFLKAFFTKMGRRKLCRW